MRLIIVGALFILFLGVSSISSLYLKMNFFNTSLEASPVIFLINKNEKLKSIARRLEERNLIISHYLFEYGARYKKLDKIIKYGEFILTDNMSIVDILKKVTTNETLTYSVVIRECITSWEIIKLFNDKYFLTDDLVGFNLNEGLYAPNTYNVAYNTKFSEILKLMKRRQTKVLRYEWNRRDKAIPIENQFDLLILASIIEKEAATIDEMPFISSVFINRLNIDMRLQSDPTVHYGLDFGNIDNRKTLIKKDLKVLNNYNTYRISGLPATPICNPSQSAINAAAHPADTNFFYFVLNESGKHLFSKTYEEHKKNVILWRNSQSK